MPGVITSPSFAPSKSLPEGRGNSKAIPGIDLALLALGLGYLWLRLLNLLRMEWSTNPQYGYGWVVPLLSIGLLVRRWRAGRMTSAVIPNDEATPNRTAAVLAFVFLAFLCLPARLVEEATPEWRPNDWLLGIEAIGLTLSAIYLVRGRTACRQAAFPVAFIAVAIPWPTLIETPVIQMLSLANAELAANVMLILGVPVLPLGNTLQVATGTVGIDDACSGIRSLQTGLMISLFLGEYYQLRTLRRVLLLPINFVLAIGFNVARTSILTWIAARNGLAAIARYHDETGVSIVLACTLVMWGVAWLLRDRSGTETRPLTPVLAPRPNFGSSLTRKLAATLLLWLAAVEIGVAAWYWARESGFKPSPGWTVVFPADNATFRDLPIADATRELLRFDEGRQGRWRENDGSVWQAFYFNWKPDRIAGYLAKRHTPEICLPAAGMLLHSGPELTLMK